MILEYHVIGEIKVYEDLIFQKRKFLSNKEILPDRL
jgi:hypothetical protein